MPRDFKGRGPVAGRLVWLGCAAIGVWLDSGVAGAGEAPPPAAQRVFLTYGDYMTGFQCLPDMVQLLLTTGETGKPGLQRLGLGIGAHGDTVGIWKSGAVAWIGGTGKVATTNWRDNGGGQKLAAAFEGRKAAFALVQLDLRYAAAKGDQTKARADAEEAVAGYVAAARAAGTNLVFYVLPGNQHATHVPSRKPGEPVKKTEADDQAELQALDAECRRLSTAHGAVMAPTHRAFAALRAAHPEIDLHNVPTFRGGDTHLSPLDAVLVALVIGRAFLGEGEHPLPTADALLTPLNKQIAAENAKRKAKGEAEQAPITIDVATWKAMSDATTAVFAVPTTPKGNP